MERTETEMDTSSQVLGRLTNGSKWFFMVPFRRRTYQNLGYVLLAFPLGLVYFVLFTVLISLGIGLAIVLVGFVILAMTVGIALILAAFERWLTVNLLDCEIEPRTTLSGDHTIDQLRSLLFHRKTWTAIVYLPTKFVLGLVSFILFVTAMSTSVSMLFVPFFVDRPGLYVGIVSDRAPEIHQTLYLGWDYLLVGIDAVITVGYWEISTLPQGIAVAVIGVLGFFATLHVVNGLATIWSRYARFMLEDCYDVLVVSLQNRE